jgi:hypothetical protein
MCISIKSRTKIAINSFSRMIYELIQKEKIVAVSLLRSNLNSCLNSCLNSWKLEAERGVAALVVIVVVGAAALVLVQGAALLGLGELDSAYTSQKGSEAFSIADGCMEEAFERMRLSTSYAGGSLNVSNGSCTITLSGSNPYTITVLGTTGNFNKKIEAVISITNKIITINSWQELSN